MRIRHILITPQLLLFAVPGVMFAQIFTGSSVINGNFATGDFTGYVRSGFFGPAPFAGGPNFATFLAAQAMGTPRADTNGVIASQSAAFTGTVPGPPIPPLHGPFLAFLSNQTNAGAGTLTGSSISQTFTVPVGARALTFDARLLSNDSANFFSTYDDFGGIAISQGANILVQYNLDLVGRANAGVFAGANAGGFLNSTPWFTPSLSLAGLAGQTVTLTAYVANYSDNFVETRLLVDNFQIQLADQCVTNFQFVNQAAGTLNFKADFVNKGSALQTVLATAASLDPYSFRIAPGQDTLSFGAPVPENSQTVSRNTFSVIMKPGATFNEDRVQWTCRTTPGQPVAKSGPNQTVRVGTVVTLDGSGSTNPAGLPALTYHWRFVSRPPATATKLFYDTAVNPTFVADVPGTYVVELTASNGVANSTTTVSITAAQ